MNDLRKINRDRLAAFLEHFENAKNSDETFKKCMLVLKLLMTSNVTYNAALDVRSNVQTIFNAINFDAVESDRLVELKHILGQEVEFDVYVRYIESILNRNDLALNLILIDVWNRLGSNVLKLPIIIYEKCIKVSPMIFEKTVLSALSLGQVSDVVDICAKSPIVFQTCSSIFNELLIKLNFTDKFMEFIIYFVSGVSSQCKNNSIDVIDIYPIECRNILILRAIKNKLSNVVTTTYLNEEVKKFVLDYPKESMCLLSHFPDLCAPN